MALCEQPPAEPEILIRKDHARPAAPARA